MKYEYVSPQEIKQNWDFVRFGLHKILRKSPEDWIPEDVYASIVCQKSILWMVKSDEGHSNGFFILQPSGDVCHIWCAWAVAPDLLEGGVEFIEQIARESGANKLTFDTNRLGWTKVAKKLGFVPRTWLKELK